MSEPVLVVTGTDATLEAAADLARQEAQREAGSPSLVGEHVEFVLEGERVGTHYFQATSAGYIGWRWAVTVARVPRARTATVSEVVLLPAAGAILAEPWVPWVERLAPGDLGPTDRLPFIAEDERLEPGYDPRAAGMDAATDQVAIVELGLDRDRVLSLAAQEAAAQRWFRGRAGPTDAGTRAAEDSCQTCGFIVPLSGPLGQVFGVCVNEWSPDDGKVVAYEHGCGAHSQTDVVTRSPEWVQGPPLLDEDGYESVTVLRESASAPQPEPVWRRNAGVLPDTPARGYAGILPL